MQRPDDHFGPGVAEGYDAAHAPMFAPTAIAPTIAVLADLAGNGRALELAIGGTFVVEVGVPALQHVPPGERFHVFSAGSGEWGVDEYDVATQGLVSHYPDVGRSIPFRYVWPAELDLMARLAGLALRERWEDWNGTPFTSASRRHVSVWELPASR